MFQSFLTGPIIRQIAQFTGGALATYGVLASNETALVIGIIESSIVLALTIRARLRAGA